MVSNQIAAIVLSVLAIGAGAAGAATVANGPPDVTPPQWANDDAERSINVSADGNVTPGETVTLTATLHGEPVPHAPVEVNGETVGETTENGTIDVAVPESDEFEVEIEPEFEGSTTVPLPEADGDEEAADDDDVLVDVSGDVAPGETVTVEATNNGMPVANATVSVNDEVVGTTDTNGVLNVPIPDDADEVEITVENGDLEGEWEYEFPEEHEADDDEERSIDLAIDGTVAPNETVTVTATVDETPLANAEVTVNGEDVGTTDANGSIQVLVPENADEFEVEAEYDYEGKMKVELVADEDENDSEEDGALHVALDGTVAPGETVTVTATADGTPVENATVMVDDEVVGTTNAAGQLDVTIPTDTDEVEIEIEYDHLEGEWEHEFEDEYDDEEFEDEDAVEDDDDEDAVEEDDEDAVDDDDDEGDE